MYQYWSCNAVLDLAVASRMSLKKEVHDPCHHDVYLGGHVGTDPFAESTIVNRVTKCEREDWSPTQMRRACNIHFLPSRYCCTLQSMDNPDEVVITPPMMNTALLWIGFDQEATRERLRAEGFDTFDDHYCEDAGLVLLCQR